MTLNEIKPARVKRLCVRREFLFVAKGHTERRRSVVVQARPRSDAKGESSEHAGAGFTATRKVGGAVVRNRAKRRLREAARALMPLHALAGADYVFIARQDTATRPWSGLLDDMDSALISLRRKLLSGEAPEPGRKRTSGKRRTPRPGANGK